MCGIAGFAGNLDPALIQPMIDRLVHRGPDASGTLVVARGAAEDRVVFGHRRLSILDLSAAGRQPLTVDCAGCGCSGGDDADGLWITYNGELYNSPALREELTAKGHRFSSGTDTEVLLHLWAEEGPEMLGRLNGIFAFAVYDGRPAGRPAGIEQGDVVLVRDGFGIKPLYVAELDGAVAFASELKALLVVPGVGRALDRVALHHYLSYLWCPAPRTALRDVHKLLPGEAVLLRRGRAVRRWEHYDLPFGRPRDPRPAPALADDLAGLLRQAVERQLLADVEVGAFLSGGLDSSAVVAMMRDLRPDARIRAWSIGFEGSIDLSYARRVADHLDVDLEVIQVESSIIGRLEECLWHLDEPQADPAPINALLIAEAAEAAGLKVLLSGAGGDDIFTGYSRHRAARYGRHWTSLPRRLRRTLAGPARAVYDGRLALPGASRTLPRRLARGLAYADHDDASRLAAYYTWGGEGLRRGLYADPVRAELEDEPTLAPMLASLARLPAGTDPVHQMLYLDCRHFLADHNLNYTDKATMARSIETRVPFLDPDLVEFAAGIPSELQLVPGHEKALFKAAMEPWLPRDVIYRPKAGFGAPLRRWLRGELRPVLDDLLSPGSLEARGIFDAAAVGRLVQGTRTGRVDGAYLIFSLLTIEMWCRIFVDGGGVKPAASG